MVNGIMKRMRDSKHASRALGMIISAFLFGVLNYFHITRPETCDDCRFPYGLPFALFRKGGYEGGGGIVWLGVLGDVAAIVIVGLILARLSRTFLAKIEADY